MRLSLPYRVVVLLGGSLVAVQVLLGDAFYRALADAEQSRIDALHRAAKAALHYAVTVEAESQRSSLETFADLSRKSVSQIELSASESGAAAASTSTGAARESKPDADGKRPGGFLARLFKRAWDPPKPLEQPGDRARASRPATDRLANRVVGLEEHRDAYPTIWHRVSAAVPELDETLRQQARQLEADTIGFAQKIVCQEDNCLILSVRPFQTRDKAQIMVVGVSSMREILAGIGSAGGYHLNLEFGEHLPDHSGDSEIWEFTEELAGIPVAEDGFSVRVFHGATGPVTPHILQRYHFIGGLGIVISLLLVALILRPVLNRVAALRAALPELPRGEYDKASDRLSKEVANNWLRDETTDLMEGAVEIIGQIQVMQDTVREQAEDLRVERDHMQSLLDTIPAAVFVLEPDARVVSGNQAAKRLLQIEPEQMRGRKISELLAPSDQRPFADACGEVVRRFGKAVHEFEVRDARGRAHLLEWHMVRIQGQGPGRLLAVALDVTQLRHSERRLTWLRTHDELTELLNRNAFEQRILSRSTPCTVLFFCPSMETAMEDVLQFPHRVAVLRHIANLLRSCFESRSDVELAYLGNFRFSALVYASRTEVEPLLESLAPRLADIVISLGERTIDFDLQVSGLEMGERRADENPRDQLNALQKFAEAQAGVIQWLTRSAVDERQDEHYRLWVEQIQRAFKEERFEIYFQPVYDTKTLQPMHSEVLVRLVESDGRVVTPDQFLRIAEQSGQIRRLDRYVFDRAVDRALQLQAEGIDHPLAVNVSAPELMQSYLLELIEKAIKERGLKRGALMIELVETHAIETLSDAIGTLEKFEAMGVPILLDDFGIGFTSFEYLRELPFEFVKIDRTFVQHLANRSDDRHLIRSIHEMVSGLRRKTIAEGVEDQKTLELLREIGVHAVQGFGLAKPSPKIRLSKARLEPAKAAKSTARRSRSARIQN